MKKLFFYTTLLFAVLSTGMVSCQKEQGFSTPDAHFISIGELRDMHQGEPLIIASAKKSEALFITGIVISDASHGNHPDGKIILQNYAEGQLRGIALVIDEPINRYLVGDSIVASVEGKVLERVDGILQVSGLTVREVGRVAHGGEPRIHIETDDFESISANSDVYESTLVALKSVEVLDVVRNQTFGDQEVRLSDGDKQIAVPTNETASFAAALVPITGNFTGIALYSANGQPYLSVRSAEDYNGAYMAPAEYPAFPEGWEDIIGARKAGNINNSGSDVYPSGRWDIHLGLSRSGAQFHNKVDDWTMMLSHTAESHVSMAFNLSHGASEFSFYYGAATMVNPDFGGGVLYVEYSQDNGETWHTLGEKIMVPDDPDRPRYYKEFNDLDIRGCVRFRVRSEPQAPAGARLSIDNIYIKPNPNSHSCEGL